MLCSYECAVEKMKQIPQLKHLVPSLAKDIELKAKAGQIESGSCCTILESHHNLLKDDPEHLSTAYIKKMSQCNCRRGLF